MQFKDVRSFLEGILSEDIHAKRVDSLANAALGVMTGASLGVAMIGKSLVQARGLLTKHAVKQVDGESLPRIAHCQARHTDRLRSSHHAIALTLGGNPGAHLATWIGMPVGALATRGGGARAIVALVLAVGVWGAVILVLWSAIAILRALADLR